MFKSCGTKIQPKATERLDMTKKEKIIFFYYEKKLNTIEISNKLKISQQYVSKIIKTDERYIEEKLERKQENKINRYNKKYNNMKEIREKNKYENDCITASMETLHRQASAEMSGKRTINNRAFKKWNSSIYEYYSRTKEYRIKKDFQNKVSYAAPKKIKWD